MRFWMQPFWTFLINLLKITIHNNLFTNRSSLSPPELKSFRLWLNCCVCVCIKVWIAQVQEKHFVTVCAWGFKIHFESQKKIPEYSHYVCSMLALVSLSDSPCSSKCISHTTNPSIIHFFSLHTFVFTSFPNVIGKMHLWCLIMQLKLADLNRPSIQYMCLYTHQNRDINLYEHSY